MRKLALIFFILCFAQISFAQKTGDRILAVIGDDMILESDFQYQLQMYLRQNQIPINQMPPYIPQQVFQSMVTDKIIYAKAVQDSITVSEDEVNRELDYRLNNMIDQFGSASRLEEFYGMTLGKIKLELKQDLAKKLMVDKLKRQKFGSGLKLTEKEVGTFFEQFKDSLPPARTQYELANIYMLRKVSDTEKRLALEKAQLILDSLKNGVPFETLAINNSDDKGSAVNGGDLGTAKKGVFVKPFEEAVFMLEVGEVSEPVETEFGYHIIKSEGKKGDEVKARHILVAFPRLESSDMETITFLNSLRDSIMSGAITFEDAAKRYSQDPNNKDKGGYAGKIPEDRLDSLEIDALKKIDAGAITPPIRIGDDRNYGYEILKLIRIIPEHNLNLTDDFDAIKQYALVYKENSELDKWINEIRDDVYVDLRVQ